MTKSEINVVCVEDGFKSLAKELKRSVKAGKVLLFAREGREGEDSAAALSLEGFSVLRRDVKDGFIMRRSFEREDYGHLVAVVGAGGLTETEAAKEYSAYGKLLTYLCPTDLTGLSALREDAEFSTPAQRVTVRSSSFNVLLDRGLYERGEETRIGLGRLFSRMVEMLDGAYAALISERKDPSSAIALFRKVCALYSDASEKRLPERIVSALLLLESEGREKGLTSVKSATELAFLTARKAGGRYDDYLFSSAYALFSLYRYYLSDLPLECAVPPDRAENAERIERACGYDAGAHIVKCERYADGYNERQRLTGEYREDLLQSMERDFPLAEFCRAYRRAPAGRESASPDPDTLLELLSLTGEEISGYALIKHIKLTGLIEPLLISA